MAQPSRKTKSKRTIKVKDIKSDNIQHSIRKRVDKKKVRRHQEYGTSKLEARFAKNFLDKLGVKYIYQYKMVSIGRYLDFFLPDSRIAIEVDGDYYHSYNILYEDMNPMQKHNKRVDKEKDHWCIINGIPLIRIWEHDINQHPEKVMQMLKERLYIGEKEQEKKNKMRRKK